MLGFFPISSNPISADTPQNSAELQATIVCSSTTTLSTAIQLASLVTCRTTVNAANLTTAIRLAAITTANTSTTSQLTTSIQLAGDVYVSSNAVAEFASNIGKYHRILVKSGSNDILVKHYTNVTATKNYDYVLIKYQSNAVLVTQYNPYILFKCEYNNTIIKYNNIIKS
jgi:hypothetical protein